MSMFVVTRQQVDYIDITFTTYFSVFSRSIWLGIKASDVATVWRTTDGYIPPWFNWNSPEPNGNPRDAQLCVWRIPSHEKWVDVCCSGSRQIYYCEGQHFLLEDPSSRRRFGYLRPSLGCARFPEVWQNFSELQILWSLRSVVFLALTLKLPIQTSLSVAPKLPVCVRLGEKCARRVHPRCTNAWLTTNTDLRRIE